MLFRSLPFCPGDGIPLRPVAGEDDLDGVAVAAVQPIGFALLVQVVGNSTAFLCVCMHSRSVVSDSLGPHGL